MPTNDHTTTHINRWFELRRHNVAIHFSLEGQRNKFEFFDDALKFRKKCINQLLKVEIVKITEETIWRDR